MAKEISWFLNYSDPEINTGRTTEVSVFDKRKDALKFAEESNVHGYIIRQDREGNEFAGWIGAFVPSAASYRELESLIGKCSAKRHVDTPNQLRYLCDHKIELI